MKFIEVQNDWNWVNEYVDDELKGDEQLYDDVLEYAAENNIEVWNVKELYQDGIEHGMTDGKYLSFKDWFYQFTETV